MPTVALCPQLVPQKFDSNGDPLSGGLLYTYKVGTTTPKATYADATGDVGVLNTNPVVLNSRGEPTDGSVFLLTDENYKFVLKTAAGATIWTVDNFGFASPTFEDVTVTDDVTVGGDITVTGSIIGTKLTQWLCIAPADQSSVISTGTAKFTFRLPACTVLAVRASLSTASSSGLPTFDINDDGTSILGANKLSIDENEETSTTATTATSIANPTIADDSEITFDIDTAGTGAKGWAIYMQVRWS